MRKTQKFPPDEEIIGGAKSGFTVAKNIFNYSQENLQLVNELKDYNIKLYILYDPVPITESYYELKNNVVVILDIDGVKIHNGEWVIYYSNETNNEQLIKVLESDKDFLIFNYPIGGLGTNNSSYGISIFYLEDKEEIMIEEWENLINTKLNYSLEINESKAKVKIMIDDKVYMDELVIQAGTSKSSISFGGNIYYEIENNKLVAYISVAYNNVNLIGHIRIVYDFLDNHFSPIDITYQSN